MWFTSKELTDWRMRQDLTLCGSSVVMLQVGTRCFMQMGGRSTISGWDLLVEIALATP